MPDHANLLVELLDEPAEAKLIGTKFRNLQLLRRWRFPVPKAFCLTTRLYLDLFRSSLSPTFSTAPTYLRALLNDRITNILGESPSGAVAIRSSSPSEDTDLRSFAGQFDTILGARSYAEVLEGILAVWRSLSSERSTAYEAAHAECAEGNSMATIIQELIPADKSGVIFTADPRTGDASICIIEAAWGLGDFIVSGAVTPDRFTLRGGTQIEHVTASKSKRHVFSPQGLQDEKVPRSLRDVPCLSTKEIHRLYQLAQDVAHKLACPQDIEFLFWQDSIFLLQTRPITTGTIRSTRAGSHSSTTGGQHET